MDSRNFLFMFYGFSAAWIIAMIFIVSLVRRGSRLRQELDDVKKLLGDRPGSSNSDRESFERVSR